LTAIRLSLPCSAGVRFLPGLKAGASSEEPGEKVKGFRSFILRGNVVDLAVGIVIGAAFTAVINGFVSAFLTPLVGLATGATGDMARKTFTVGATKFPYRSTRTRLAVGR
ncbi:large conductance mechanosensitive channel protein MscL, partial [Streptomyces sp. NPDC004393]